MLVGGSVPAVSSPFSHAQSGHDVSSYLDASSGQVVRDDHGRGRAIASRHAAGELHVGA